MKNPLNSPDVRKNVAQVLKYTEIEGTWPTESKELLHGP